MPKAEVDIRALKRSVASKLGPTSILQKVLLAEPDQIPTEELIGKIGTWLAILEQDLEDRP